MIDNLKITFYLDGTGVYYNPVEPIHLDALMAWCLMPYHKPKNTDPPNRDEKPFEIDLPFQKWEIQNNWGWMASALFPGDRITGETLQYWRKKFRTNRIDLVNRNPNLQMGNYREYNVPLQLTLCSKMICYCRGNFHRVLQPLKKHIKYLGKKSSYGKGRVIDIVAERVDFDYSMRFDKGTPSRFLPDKNGTKRVRCRPPYWNNTDRILCIVPPSKVQSVLLK